MPRVTYALAEQGDFPQAFAAIHPRFHTPYVSILVFAALVVGFALVGEFKWNVTLSAVARLLYYACAAPRFQCFGESSPNPRRFRLPAGNCPAGLLPHVRCASDPQVDHSQSMIVCSPRWPWAF